MTPKPELESENFHVIFFAVFVAPLGHSEDRRRLLFAMDVTMSRQPTWDLALGLQADMFRGVKEVGEKKMSGFRLTSLTPRNMSA